MLNIVVWLAVGAVIGLVSGLLMRNEDDGGMFVNVFVGIAGALVAGWFAAPRVGLHVLDPKVFNFGALAVALIGAVLPLAALSLLRRRAQAGRG
jgi:uncharacterized membrane protein YeaQ/YmgE (transglycosylase-associated protein family)